MTFVTPSGKSANFDAGVPRNPPRLVYEAKTGHENFPSQASNNDRVWNTAGQFFEQREVARECKLQYIIAVDNVDGALTLQSVFKGFPINYVPGPIFSHDR